MNKFFNALFVRAFLIATCSTMVFAQNKPGEIPKEVKDLVGTYRGSWTSYGVDASGQVVKQMAWTDSVKAENPVVEKGRAFVTTITEMVFEGGKILPIKISGKEGYSLESNGSLGNYFIEIMGQTHNMRKLDEHTWAYTTPAAPQELRMLGAANIQSAHHVLLKVITLEQGVETHHISRLTTLRWKDSSGKELTRQFVSLQGQHKRQRN